MEGGLDDYIVYHRRTTTAESPTQGSGHDLRELDRTITVAPKRLAFARSSSVFGTAVSSAYCLLRPKAGV